MKKIFILGMRTWENRRIYHEVKKMGHDCEIVSPDDLIPFITDTQRDRLYKATATDEPQRIYKKDLNSVICRIGANVPFHSKTVKHIQTIGIPTTATPEALMTAHDKVSSILAFSKNRIKTPKTFALRTVKNFSWIVNTLGGFPIVCKTLSGSKGNGIFILTDELSGKTTLQAFLKLGHELLAQQYIETSKDDMPKHDYRLVVVNGKVICSIKRTSGATDFRTNSSIQDNATNFDAPDDMKQMAIDCAAAVGLKVAGVDLARHSETSELYCYEINSNLGFKAAEKHTGVNVAKAIAEYALEISSHEVKTSTPQPTKAEMFIRAAEGIPFGVFPDDTEDDLEDDQESRSTFADYKPIDRELAELGSILKTQFLNLSKKY